MAFSQLQKDVDQIIKENNWTYWQPLEIAARLSEENGELARELLDRFGPKKKKAEEEKKEVEDELADMLFTIACLANKLDLDLDGAWQRTLEKSRVRDKGRYLEKK